MIYSLFSSDELIELAFQTIAQLLRERPLHLPTAQSACQNPAGPATIFTVVDTMLPRIARCGSHAKFTRIRTACLAATFFEFPPILLCHFPLDEQSLTDLLLFGDVEVRPCHLRITT